MQHIQNKAAWAEGVNQPFVVKDAPDWPIEDSNHVKIRVHTVAMNPADHFFVDSGAHVTEWPAMFGYDVAGEIVEVGSGVTNVKVGDRVGATTLGIYSGIGNKGAGFQLYPLCPSDTLFKIPDKTSYTDAAVFPIGTATAAVGLFGRNFLALDYPQPTKPTKTNGKVLLVWGGSSSVGACAIQMAVYAGYEVISTSSSANFDLVKSFGASYVFDYKSETVLDDIASILKGREQDYVGAYSAVQDNTQTPPAVFLPPKLGLTNESMVATSKPRALRDGLPELVRLEPLLSTQMFGPSNGFPSCEEVGKEIFGRWLPAALEAGMKAVPRVKIVGKGLESINGALDLLRHGKVSGEKVVVEV